MPSPPPDDTLDTLALSQDTTSSVTDTAGTTLTEHQGDVLDRTFSFIERRRANLQDESRAKRDEIDSSTCSELSAVIDFAREIVPPGALDLSALSPSIRNSKTGDFMGAVDHV
jgi:hypothetical protein